MIAVVSDAPNKELEQIREKLGLTIRKFAEKLGVPEARYKNWEYGRTAKVPETILTRARRLGRRPDPLTDSDVIDGFATMVAVRCWASANASLGDEDSCSFQPEELPYEVPAAFLIGGVRHIDRHDLVKVSGNSMAPVMEPGDRVLFYQDPVQKANAIVMAESPEGQVIIKVLRREGPQWALRSINPNGASFTHLNGWKLHGYAIAILRDTDGPLPNVTWPFGQAIRIPE